jgi:high affinity Mn2+ porin
MLEYHVRDSSRYIHAMAGAAAWYALTVTGSPGAGSIPLKAPALATYDWTGFYFGGHVGYVVVNSDWTTMSIGGGAPLLSGSADIFDRDGPWGPMVGGIQGGYNYVFPSHFLMGFETDISFPNHLTGSQTFSSAATGQYSIGDKVELFSTARARAGYAFGDWLVYGTGGLAFDRDLLSNTQQAGRSAGDGVLPGNIDQKYFSRYGWTVGLGAELGLSQNWSAKLEYDFMDFGSRNVLFPLEAQIRLELGDPVGAGGSELPFRQ